MKQFEIDYKLSSHQIQEWDAKNKQKQNNK